MCRWFAYISHSEPCLLEDVLISPKHSLSKQVHDHYLPKLIHHDSAVNVRDQQKQIDARNVLYNIDGLGVAWYTSAKSDFHSPNIGGTVVINEGLRPAMYKTIQPPLNDFNFRSICANTSTRCCFAHIRAASATAIASVNNHPFIFGRYAFMHNGVVSDFVRIQRQLSQLIDDDAFANIQGSTDSEHLAAVYMTFLTGGKGRAAWEVSYELHDMLDAMQRTIALVVKLQNDVLGQKKRPNSLNLALTDGKKLVTVRFRNHKTEEPPSLYYSTTAGVKLNRKYPERSDGTENPIAMKREDEHGGHLIVASEPSTYKASDWTLIKRNHFLMYDGAKVELDPVKYEDSWDADDPE
ncbi:N-terminal nucleophile aminohydrolase [Viridothelium virens]|uniref:N-terminal nucleophile aminohydrolase n=1 Tax=Viridothelium virens TaxID=1048519 RepID=A0A6A6HDE5_VIRVR|nr:N-terminal nucleophile aminohydrolase [Viridothelium virens]